MSDPDIPGLAKVPPHKRENVRKRILVIERFLANESSEEAEAGATELGMGLASFHALARAWRHNRSAVELAGAGHPRADHHRLNQAQTDVISAAVAEMPGAVIEHIGARAVEIARERSVPMVGWAPLTRHIGILATGRLPSDSPAAAADLVIEHCVIDLPVGDPATMTGRMPIATLVTNVEQARVLGLSLVEETPTAEGTARALAEALKRLTPTAGARTVTIYLNSLRGPGWQSLREVLDRPGIALIDKVGEKVSPPNATIRLLGHRLVGIRLMPRLGRRLFVARPATIEVGGRPLELDEAEDFLRARWTSTAVGQSSLPIDQAAAGSLRTALAAFIR